MLELVPRPQFSVVVPPKLLQEGYLVRFTDAWPSTLPWVRDKMFRVETANQVPYSTRYIIPSEDYRDVDLSNGDDEAQESIYPTRNNSLFEVTLGLSAGAYVVHFFIPATRHIHSLEYAGMTPDVTSATLVYLGARRPEDSPIEDPRIKFYLVRQLSPLILRVFALPAVDYEKAVFEFVVNKLNLAEIESPTQEQQQRAKVIRYYDELRYS